MKKLLVFMICCALGILTGLTSAQGLEITELEVNSETISHLQHQGKIWTAKDDFFAYQDYAQYQGELWTAKAEYWQMLDRQRQYDAYVEQQGALWTAKAEYWNSLYASS